MALQHREIEHQSDGVGFTGRLTWDDAQAGPRPGVLVCHTIRGRTAFEEGKAEALAESGYTALAVDLYGTHTRDSDIETFRELMIGHKDDRPRLQRRLLEWLELLAGQDEVDAERLGAIGFCFGGLCVLDIARTGADLKGVVSFHGLFEAPGNTSGNDVRARVLVLHGWDDPLAPPDMVLELGKELTSMGADWQIHAYGNTLHAFTNPAANDSSAGTVYNDNANRRSWQAMQNFFDEVFAR